MRENIVLIGMPGVGKSTVGVVLAKLLGMDFIDSDLVIQHEEGKLLHQLIKERGTEEFLRLEDRINSRILPKLPSVIATGGSVVYGLQAMEHFSRIATVVYLSLNLHALKERLGDLHERGVVLRKGQTLEDLYGERLPLYLNYAGITIDCEGKEIRHLAEEIAAAIRKADRKEEGNEKS